jgi:hypothetical protein
VRALPVTTLLAGSDGFGAREVMGFVERVEQAIVIESSSNGDASTSSGGIKSSSYSQWYRLHPKTVQLGYITRYSPSCVLLWTC